MARKPCPSGRGVRLPIRCTIVESQCKPGPEAWSDNDHFGRMSAWLEFTTLAFCPLAPAANEYVIGRRFLHGAAIRLPDQKRLTIVADAVSDSNRCIGKVTLNGTPLNRL